MMIEFGREICGYLPAAERREWLVTNGIGGFTMGTIVWVWLIGPFVTAHLRVYGDMQAAWAYLRPLFHHLADHELGSISEFFDSDEPFSARGVLFKPGVWLNFYGHGYC